MISVDDLKRQARRHEAAGRFDRAVECYERALERQRDEGSDGGGAADTSLYLSLADLHFRQDRVTEALDYYRRAADAYASAGLIQNAISVHKMSVRLFPERPEPYVHLADLYLRAGDPDRARLQAEELSEKVAESSDVASDAVFRGARRYRENGGDSRANPELIALLEETGCLAVGSGDVDGADADRDGAADEEAEGSVPEATWEAWKREEVLGGSVQDEDDEEEPAPEPAPDADAGVPEAERDDAALPTDAGEPVAEPGEAAEEADLAAGAPEAAAEAERDAAEDERSAAEDAADDGAGPGFMEWDFLAGLRRNRPSRPSRPRSSEREEAEPERAARDRGTGREEQESGEPEASEEPAAETGEPRTWREEIEKEEDDDAPDSDKPGLQSAAPVDEEGRARSNRRWNWPPSPEGDAAESDEPAGPLSSEEAELEEGREDDGAEDPVDVDPRDDVDDAQWTAGPSYEPADEPAGEVAGEAAGEPGGEPAFDQEPPVQEPPVQEPPVTEGPADEVAEEPAARRPGAWPRVREPGGGESEGEGPDAHGARSPAADLRSGLEVLQEMLELRPGSMDLLRRKAAYARRLGDESLLVESWLDLARTLRGRDGSRGARLLAMRVLEMDPDNPDARKMLRPVDRAAIGAGDVADESLTGALEAGSDPEAAGSIRQRVAREFADEVGALRWLEAATEISLPTYGELPEDFFHYFGRYLMAHGRWEDAADMLERVAGRDDALDAGEYPELVFSLALIYRRTGRHDRAVECFRRLAASEESFASAWRSLPESGAV